MGTGLHSVASTNLLPMCTSQNLIHSPIFKMQLPKIAQPLWVGPGHETSICGGALAMHMTVTQFFGSNLS